MKSLKSTVQSAPQFRLASCQVLSSHTWRVPIALCSRDLSQALPIPTRESLASPKSHSEYLGFTDTLKAMWPTLSVYR